MAMHDWNGNGNKNDLFDNSIEYQIYRKFTNNTSSQKNSSGSSSSGLGIVLFLIVIVLSIVAGLS